VTTAGVKPTVGVSSGDGGAAAGRIGAGTCSVMFAYDAGFAIDLDAAERRITEATVREVIRHRRRAPAHFDFRPAPLRVTQAAEPIPIGSTPWRTGASVECVLYDFGAVSVTYTVPLGADGNDGSAAGAGPRDLDGLLLLSNALYDNAALLADSRRRVERLVAALGPAIAKPEISDLVEDYVIYQIRELPPGELAGGGAARWFDRHGARVAQVLRSESEPLSAQEVAEALAARCSYTPADEAVIDWNAAVLLMDDAEEVKTVLEFANVELLEVRFLDDMLDRALERAYEALQRESRRGLLGWGSDTAGLERLARLQVDSAILFEGVNNALKLVGDQYLARLYRLAAHRLHLPEWDASILRKLETVESIYQKIHDRQSTRRMELLEWIIIVLIAISILVMFLPNTGGH
jgi:hypothetical protein